MHHISTLAGKEQPDSANLEKFSNGRIIHQVHTVLDDFLLSINALHVSETHQDKCSPISLRMWVEAKECTVGDITRGREPEVTSPAS